MHEGRKQVDEGREEAKVGKADVETNLFRGCEKFQGCRDFCHYGDSDFDEDCHNENFIKESAWK